MKTLSELQQHYDYLVTQRRALVVALQSKIALSLDSRTCLHDDMQRLNLELSVLRWVAPTLGQNGI